MRIALTMLTATVLILGAFALAQGDEAAPTEVTPKAFKALEARVEALQAEVTFLRSREETLRAYVLKNGQRARGLLDVVARARRAGFEASKIPVDSRRILLAGLEAAANSLRQGLPKVSDQEARMMKEAARLRRAAGMD